MLAAFHRQITKNTVFNSHEAVQSGSQEERPMFSKANKAAAAIIVSAGLIFSGVTTGFAADSTTPDPGATTMATPAPAPKLSKEERAAMKTYRDALASFKTSLDKFKSDKAAYQAAKKDYQAAMSAWQDAMKQWATANATQIAAIKAVKNTFQQAVSSARATLDAALAAAADAAAKKTARDAYAATVAAAKATMDANLASIGALPEKPAKPELVKPVAPTKPTKPVKPTPTPAP